MRHFDSDFEKDLYAARQQTLRDIAALGYPIYPNRFPAEGEADTIAHLRSTYDQADAPTSAEFDAAIAQGKPIPVAVAGRLMAIRTQGKAGFSQLQGSGQRLQIYVRKDAVGDTAFALYKLLDLGDHIGVHGYLFRTRTGELTIHVGPGPRLASGVQEPPITFLAKAMLALPDKYHGLEDVELRYRQRYVDLIMNSGTLSKQELPPRNQEPGSSPVTETSSPDAQHMDAPRNVREVFEKRSKILRSIRKFFDNRGYLEVETPMMHTVAGGAAARPFKTHHNALDIDLSLRIAPELYLKKLVVGGLDRVYEINRNFRNEGVSTQHNPEFTMLEFYQAYSNYEDLMTLTEELVTKVATEVNGTPITHFNGVEIDLSKWTRLSMREAIIKFWLEEGGERPDEQSLSDPDAFGELLTKAIIHSVRWHHARVAGDPNLFEPKLIAVASPLVVLCTFHRDQLTTNLAGDRKDVMGKAIASLFELLAEPHLIQPTIIYDFPLAVSPLSKRKPDEPDWVERFEFYIGGFEVGNAFSELNDPEEQRKRFEQQLQERDRGDDEAHAMDEDYVRALGYGLPPTAGEGIGIDRLTMLLTGSRSIRDVILFPLMRPQATAPHAPGPGPAPQG